MWKEKKQMRNEILGLLLSCSPSHKFLMYANSFLIKVPQTSKTNLGLNISVYVSRADWRSRPAVSLMFHNDVNDMRGEPFLMKSDSRFWSLAWWFAFLMNKKSEHVKILLQQTYQISLKPEKQYLHNNFHIVRKNQKMAFQFLSLSLEKRLNRQCSFYSFDEISFFDGCFELSIFLFTSQRRQIKHSSKDNLKSKHSRKHWR